MRAARLIPTLMVAVLLAPPVARADVDREWRFRVLLDGSPIGFQVFRMKEDGDVSRVSIEASFDVKVLFFTAYSYRHRNEEVWEDGCLRSMRSMTDDNGEEFRVEARSDGDVTLVDTRDGREQLPGCVDSFAYWDPDELRAERLLNSQTGEYEKVRVTEVGREAVEYRGETTQARRVSITGEDLHIDLWYAGSDDWIALESRLKNGRTLTYRRE